ncbi:MAG: aminotransferase class IV [Solirubrobacteraceae bacterium]
MPDSHAGLPASLDGLVMPATEAAISVLDEGLLRGDGVFEVIRVYDGRPYALDRHLQRLERSASNLLLPLDLDAVAAEITSLLAAAPAHEGLMRLVITRGGRRILLLELLPDHPATVRLGCVTYSPTRVLDGVKSLSYAANMLATRRAKQAGFDEALLVTPHGRVLETPTASFFWVSGGELRTPPLDDHILASITRADVIELTGAREHPCTREDLETADEAFIASTLREVMPASALEARELAAPGPLTAQAADALREHIAGALAARA